MIHNSIENSETHKGHNDDRISKDSISAIASRNWINSLSFEEKTAITEYTMENPQYYKNINGVLRGTEKEFIDGNDLRSDLIHSALSKANIPERMTVYRGCSDSALASATSRSDDDLVGLIIYDRGFTSTSLSRNVASGFGGDILLRINLPESTKAALIESISLAGHREKEVLIDKGTAFAITNVNRSSDGRRIVDLEAYNPYE